jgi:lysine-N-methylase
MAVSVPSYFLKFKCNPNECLESCCKRWKINIDEDTYNKYKNSKNEIINKIASDYLEVKDEPLHADDYGFIRLDASLNCPFLRSDEYCEVHKSLGEEALSKTCHSYPRIGTVINDQIEYGLQLSCSVALDLLMEDEGKFTIDKTQMENDSRLLKRVIGCSDEKYELYHLISNHLFQLLENREHTIQSRLHQVLTYIKKINDIKYESYDEKKEHLVQIFKEIDEIEYYPQVIDFETLNELLSLRFNDQGFTYVSKRYIECLMNVFDVLEDTTDLNLIMNEIYIHEVETLINKNSYIFEKYLMNHVFNNRYLLLNKKKSHQFLTSLIVSYGLIVFNLVGLSKYHNHLDKPIILKVIQSLTKTITSDFSYFDKVDEKIKVDHLRRFIG